MTPASGDALLRLGASAVATPSGRRVGVVTKAGRWNATLDRPEPDPAGGASPDSLGALVAGLVPGLLLGWSWPTCCGTRSPWPRGRPVR